MADYLPESNINWLYKNSNIFALLPRGEGFGLTIFESCFEWDTRFGAIRRWTC